MKEVNDDEKDEKLAPYFYVRDHHINTFAELDAFNKKFPDATDGLVFSIVLRLMDENRKKRLEA